MGDGLGYGRNEKRNMLEKDRLIRTLRRQLEEVLSALIHIASWHGWSGTSSPEPSRDRVLEIVTECHDKEGRQLTALQADNEQAQQEIKRLRTTWTPPVDDLRALAQPEKP